MTRDKVIESIKREHENFLAAIDNIPTATLESEKVTDEWTIKDLLGHMAMWMNVANKFIADYRATGAPKSLGLKDDAALAAYNARGWEERRELPLAQVRDEFDAAYRELIARTETLADAELTEVLPPPWGDGDTLESLIAINSYTHNPEHTEQVKKWRSLQSSSPGKARVAIAAWDA